MPSGKRTPPTPPPAAPARRAATEVAPEGETGTPPGSQTSGRPARGETPVPIVGIGASAGGLEAFELLFRALPADTGMAFVLVQHLDPAHASMLGEILQRSTAMRVLEAEHGMPVVPDHVYVIPPNREMGLAGGVLQLSLPPKPRGQRLPIDAFFRALAEDQGDRAVGVLLSGTGSDGTLGLRAIFGAGGVCLVQEPGSAKYEGMPGSAVQAGYATQVLTVDRIAAALCTVPRQAPARASREVAPAAGSAGLGPIVTLLRSATGHDFSQYKKSTLGRRIERRMAQHGIESSAAYVRLVKEHPAELQALFKELLINVTSFFRDPDAFSTLQHEVLPQLMAGRPHSQPLRIWVAGCASGEEAYSIAILLRELMDESQRDFPVQLYATDLDEEAIVTARTGTYPAGITQDVSPERLRRFFVKEDDGFRVKKEIREMVVFAVQSIIKDPPFTRLDLLACRNLMIYLEPDLQARLIPAFHYALKPGGVLFLSPSESTGQHTDLFEPIHRKSKIYRAIPSIASTRAVLNGGLSWAVDGGGRISGALAHKSRGPDFAEVARRALLQSFAPASVVTDLQGNIVYVHGDTGRYLRPAPGQPTLNVIEMAREGLQMALREALSLAVDKTQPTLNRELTTQGEGGPLGVGLSVRFLSDASAGHGLLLVSFQELPQGAAASPPRRRRASTPQELNRVAELERELVVTKESLHAALEEQQAFNEELKSTNEEMQSTNEELQSTNEELETSKEELHSVNEELVTVNSELQSKIEQMTHMQNDMKNLLDNIRVGAIFLDRQMMIKRFTRDATAVFRLIDSDIGRRLSDITSDLHAELLLSDAAAVLESLVPVEREFAAPGGVHYLARVQPYRTVDNYIDGVVLTFTDVTERLQAITDRKARELAEAIVDTVTDPLLVLDGELRVVSASASFYRHFAVDASQTVGQRFDELGERQWNIPALRHQLQALAADGSGFEGFEVEHDFPSIGRRRVKLNGRRIASSSARGELMLVAIHDLQAAGGR